MSRIVVALGALALAGGLGACTTTESRLAGAGTGAVAGAAVAGPIGAGVGGVAGAVAGPSVSRELGTSRRRR